MQSFKNILLVVDYQNDFITGSLGSISCKNVYIDVINRINFYLNNNDIIIFTKDTHNIDYLKTEEGQLLPIEHCIKGTDGHNLYGDLIEFENNLNENIKIIEKTHFALNDLNFLNDLDFNEIEIIGVATNICVLTNAIFLKSTFQNTKIKINESCCASYDDIAHAHSINIMKNLGFTII
ncbi:MAG: cysteine hydrolase family protein [Oscillospiraceae bacterium]